MEYIIIAVMFIIILVLINDKNNFDDSKQKLLDAKLLLLETRINTNKIKITLLQMDKRNNQLLNDIKKTKDEL